MNSPANPTAPAPTLPRREQVTKPPVVARRFLTRLDVSREEFDDKALAIMQSLQKEGGFDEIQMREQWDFHLDVQGPVPRPKVRLNHAPVAIRNPTPTRPRTVVELFPPVEGRPARLTLEQGRADETPSRFEDLERECHTAVPHVLDGFGIHRIGGFLLEYRNEIRRDRYPAFWDGDNTLLLAKLLWLFRNNPGPGNFVTPFSVEFNAATELGAKSNISFQMHTEPTGKPDFVLVFTLGFSTLAREDKRTIDALWNDLTKAHGLLFDNFLRQFPQDALDEFCR